MTDYAANLLNELMGRNRDLLPDQKSKKLTVDSPEVCRYYMVRLCPHDLFTNTKVDLGPCGGIHDDDVKAEYDMLPPHRRVVYEDEFLRYCQAMLNDVERKIRKSKQRLELQPDDEKLASLVPPQFSRHEERVAMLTDKISKLVSQVEQLGCKGQVEEAQGIMRLCDKLKDERDKLRRANEGSVWQQAAEMAASQEKQMQVCEICGAFLILGDAQQRIDDHLTGKQHMGYARLKLLVEEMREGRDQEKRDQEMVREREREERRSQRQAEPVRSDQEMVREREREERRSQREAEPVRSAGSRDRERERSGRSDERSSRSDERSGRSDERSSRSDERSGRSDERSGRGEERSSRGEERSGRGEERSSRGEERSSRGEERSSRGEERSSRGEERSSRGEERSGRGEERDPESRDRRRARSRSRERDRERERRHSRDRDRERGRGDRQRDRDSERESRRDRDAEREARWESRREVERDPERDPERDRSGHRHRRRPSRERPDSRDQGYAVGERRYRDGGSGPETRAPGPRTPSAEPPEAVYSI